MMRDDDQAPPNFEGFGARPAPDPALPRDLIADRSLLRSAKGDVRACEFNARVLLGASERFAALHWDDFLARVRVEDRDWTDHDDRDALLWLQATHRVPGFTLGQTRNAVLALAYDRRRDSLREFVGRLPEWDGTPRIRTAFRDAWGAADDELVRMSSFNFFVALLARAKHPGCQVDTLWTWEGDQGGGKSRAARTLGGPFYAEITAPIGTADFMRELRGVWLAEMGELDSLRGKEASTVKRLLSAPTDRFVDKFERHATAYPRRAVLVASTNEASYWQDATGARRLVPIRVGRIDVPMIDGTREQWFAEARNALDHGATWWEFPAAIRDAQEERQQGDLWEDTLRRLIADGAKARSPDPAGTGFVEKPWPIDGEWISAAEIMAHWLRIEPAQQGPQSSTRLRHVMRRLGYRPERGPGRLRPRGWVRDADT